MNRKIGTERVHGTGNIGVFAINTQKQEMTVDVPAPEGGPWEATFYLGTDPQQAQFAQLFKK